MFVENEYLNKRYQGLNPEFYRRAMKKREAEERRRAEAEKLAKEATAKAEAKARAESSLADLQASQTVASMLSQYRELEVTFGKKSVRQIILETAIKYNVRAEDITGASRAKDIIPARHEAMWRARYERPDLSLPTLGKVFNRDHSTCLAAIRKIDRQRKAA